MVAAALGEIRGATAPRLLLELMCARVLLPAADDGLQGVQARLDRIERRMALAGTEHTPAARHAPGQPTSSPAPTPAAPAQPAVPTAASAGRAGRAVPTGGATRAGKHRAGR